MLSLNDAVSLRDKVYAALSASSDWAPGYRKNRKYFKVLVSSEAKLDRELRKYFKELSERVVDRVNWVKYQAEVTPSLSAAAPKVNVIVNFTQDDIDDEIQIVTRLVYKEIAAVVAAGAASQITDSRIPVANLSVLVDKIARDRAADLATQMTQTTVDKVRSSISTSLQLGEDVKESTARLSAFIDDPAKAEMIAKTESANAWRRGVIETAKESGAESKTWNVEGDPCKICQGLDGETVPIDDVFSTGDSGEDGAHPNCKCDISTNYPAPNENN